MRAPGSLGAFILRLLNDRGQRLRGEDFFDEMGTVLDLVARGPLFVENPASQSVLEVAPVAPFLGAEIVDAPPAPAVPVNAGEMLAFLRCAPAGGAAADDCAGQVLPPVAADLSTFPYGVLGTPRAREAAALYRNLLAAGEPPDTLREALAAASEDYRKRTRAREVDGAAFRAHLDRSSDPSARRVLAYLERIAELSIQIRLVGLTGEAFDQVELAILSELADRLSAPGLPFEALREAVNADYPGLFESAAQTPPPR